MENAVDALKIAFAVMIFVMALTLSISSFSNANQAIDSIVKMSDRETEYTYVEPSENLTRKVGMETVVTTMYRAIEENIEIYFFDEYGNEVTLYRDLHGEYTNSINFSNSENGKFTDKEDARAFLDVLLGGENAEKFDIYKHKLINRYYYDGWYDDFKYGSFEEILGEYTEGSGATEIKKRVITYIWDI